MLKEKQKQNPTKVNEPRLFFFVIFTIQSWLCLKMDSRWHLELSSVQLRKTNQKESQNSGISGSWATGFSYTQTRRTAGRPWPRSRPGLGPALPHSAIPDGRAAAPGWRSRHCLLTVHLLFPPPPTPFLAFTLCQMGVNSSSSFKTLLGGGDSQAPSGTPTVPVTLLYPDPAHTPAGDSRSGLSPP